MTRGPLWKRFPHHEHVEPVCEKPTQQHPTIRSENNGQPSSTGRKHCLQDLLEKDSSEITTTDVGSARFAERIPAMTEQLKLAKRTADYLLRISNVPNEL